MYIICILIGNYSAYSTVEFSHSRRHTTTRLHIESDEKWLHLSFRSNDDVWCMNLLFSNTKEQSQIIIHMEWKEFFFFFTLFKILRNTPFLALFHPFELFPCKCKQCAHSSKWFKMLSEFDFNEKRFLIRFDRHFADSLGGLCQLQINDSNKHETTRWILKYSLWYMDFWLNAWFSICIFH